MRIGPAALHHRLQEVVQPLRCRKPPLDLGGHVGDLHRPPVEGGQVGLRQSQRNGDHMYREHEHQLVYQIGPPPVDEGADVVVEHRVHNVVLPPLHLPAGERLLDQLAVLPVLGLVHLQDGVAHHQSHRFGVPRRRESGPVPQHRLHSVVRQHVHNLPLPGHQVANADRSQHLRHAAPVDRALGQQLGVHLIGVDGVLGPLGLVEGVKRVVPFVTGFGGSGSR